MTQRQTVSLTINGVSRKAEVDVRTNLADFIRHELGLTGTHVGCEHGVCGACTIIVNGLAVRSCLMLAVQAQDAVIETIEGLSQGGTLSPLQQAFSTHHALQCGFCTPGMLMTLTALLRENQKATESEIREAISGNLCRCTGYQGIVEAAREIVTSGGGL